MNKPKRKYPSYEYEQNKMCIDEASGNGVYNQACDDWEAYHKWYKEKFLSSKKEIKGLANEICNEIVADLTDRSGLRQAWDLIDDDITTEIEEKWNVIITKAIAKRIGKETQNDHR